jgi:hypothetical protein
MAETDEIPPSRVGGWRLKGAGNKERKATDIVLYFLYVTGFEMR